jgi:hypothetical protein
MRAVPRGGGTAIVSVVLLSLACHAPAGAGGPESPIDDKVRSPPVPPELAFLPADTQGVLRLRIAAVPDAVGGQWRESAAEFLGRIPGCAPGLYDLIDDVIVGFRRGFNSKEAARGYALRITGRLPPQTIRSCLDGLSRTTRAFYVTETDGGLLVEDDNRNEIVSVTWIPGGLVARHRSGARTLGPAPDLRDVMAQIDLDGPMWVTFVPNRGGKHDVDGVWLTMAWSKHGLRVRFAVRFLGRSPSDRWLDEVIGGFLKGAAKRGLRIDPVKARAKMVESRRGRWHQFEVGWTVAELEELMQDLGQAASTPPTPAPAAGDAR